MNRTDHTTNVDERHLLLQSHYLVVMAEFATVIANKFLLTFNVIAALVLFVFLVFFWDSTFYSDFLPPSTKSSSTTTNILPTTRGRLCTPLSGCKIYSQGDNVTTTNLFSMCAAELYGFCNGSVRCCRDCKMISFETQWNTRVANKKSPNDRILVNKVPYKMIDVHHTPLIHGIVGIVFILLINLVGILTSRLEVRSRHSNNDNLFTIGQSSRYARKLASSNHALGRVCVVSFVWVCVFLVTVGTMVLLVGGLVYVVELSSKTDNLLEECRIIFLSLISWLAVVFVFYFDFLLGINFGYAMSKNKRTMRKMIKASGPNELRDNETMELLMSTVKIINSTTNSNRGILSIKGDTSDDRGFKYTLFTCFYKFCVCFNTILLVWWIVLAADIILLYKGSHIF